MRGLFRFMRRFYGYKYWVYFFLLAVLTRCAPLPNKPGFDDVQTLVGTRMPQEITISKRNRNVSSIRQG